MGEFVHGLDVATRSTLQPPWYGGRMLIQGPLQNCTCPFTLS
ncbi:MAG: hypothetical protein RL518_2404 [Pseudomonadota bacterium]|jgi:hypothetical protein